MPPSENKFTMDTSIPPPLDPFPTYQTPFPRTDSSDDQNPFISFRRFADDQFNSLFTGISRTLGVPTPLSFPRPYDEKHAHSSSRRRNIRDDDLGVETCEATDYKDLDEGDRRLADWLLLEPARRYAKADRERARLDSLPSQEDPSSELDLYERLEADSRSKFNESDRDGAPSSWKGGPEWDARYARQDLWDRNRRIEAAQQKQSGLTSDVDRHAHLDPSDAPEDLFPFIAYSKYSPVHLKIPRGYERSDDQIDFDQRLADRLYWVQALKDLSREKRMERCHEGKAISTPAFLFQQALETYGGPFLQEMRKVPEHSLQKDKGNMINLSEGEYWDGDIEVSPLCTGIMTLLAGAALSGFPSPKVGHVALERSDEVSGEDIKNKTHKKRMESLRELIRVARQSQPDPSQCTQDQPELKQDQQPPVETTWSRSSYSSSSWSTSTPKDQDPNSVVSTLTTTEVWTLPDGTSESRRVLKKRFADGREENSESVRTRPKNAQASAGIETRKPPHMVESKVKEDQSKSKSNSGGGWFWN